jgi:hypothetical protein
MSQRGKRFSVLCGDGKVRSAVVTVFTPWPRAAVQVTIDGKRRTVSGNLSGAGFHKLPPGVSHRFLSNRLTALVGFTQHRPLAPLLRRLMGRAFGSTSSEYAGEFAFLAAAALYQLHEYTFDGYRPGAGNGEPFTRGDFDGWQRETVRKLSAETLKRLTALAWRAHKFSNL